MGDGKTHPGWGICQLHLKLGELDIVQDFLPMPMGSSDIILGMKWLAIVRETWDDWKNLTMTRTING